MAGPAAKLKIRSWDVGCGGERSVACGVAVDGTAAHFIEMDLTAAPEKVKLFV